MKTLFCLILLLRMASAGAVAEIVGWKVPLSRFLVEGLDSDGIARCKAAPEASPFFKEGDELWDLKRISAELRKETSPPLEWAVWNASSGRLVVKGDWFGIWQLHGQLQADEHPKLCRLTAEVFEVLADGSPLAENSKPVSVLSWVTKCSQGFDVSREDGGRTIRSKGEVSAGVDASVLDVRMEVSCKVADQPEMRFQSGITLRSGKSIWVARDFDGAKGMDVRFSGAIELLDGSPAYAVMLVQKNGSIQESVKPERGEMKRYPIGDHGWLAVQALNPDFFSSLDMDSNHEGAAEADPFADTVPAKPLPTGNLRERLGIAEVSPPAAARPWFDGQVWNIREALKGTGCITEESKAFAGYDPLSQRVFMISKDPRELDMFQALFQTCCVLPPKMAVMTLTGSGQIRLVTRSGERAWIGRYLDKNKEVRLLELEPTIAQTDGVVDLRVVYFDESAVGTKHSITNAIVLKNGQPFDLLGGSSGGGEPLSLRLTAVVETVAE